MNNENCSNKLYLPTFKAIMNNSGKDRNIMMSTLLSKKVHSELIYLLITELNFDVIDLAFMNIIVEGLIKNYYETSLLYYIVDYVMILSMKHSPILLYGVIRKLIDFRVDLFLNEQCLLIFSYLLFKGYDLKQFAVQIYNNDIYSLLMLPYLKEIEENKQRSMRMTFLCDQNIKEFSNLVELIQNPELISKTLISYTFDNDEQNYIYISLFLFLSETNFNSIMHYLPLFIHKQPNLSIHIFNIIVDSKVELFPLQLYESIIHFSYIVYLIPQIQKIISELYNVITVLIK